MTPSRLLLGLIVTVVTLPMVYALFQAPHQTVASEPLVTEYDPLTDRPNEEGDAGELSYRRYCSGCHGIAGDGNGPAARFLDPKPRDFTKGEYKFKSTESGTPPLDEDILLTITRGLHGTSMPGWRLLPDHERRALVRYIRSFYKDWNLRPPAKPIPFYGNPFDLEYPEDIEAALTLGSEIYHKIGRCWSCHPGYEDEKKVEEMIGVPPGPEYAPAIAKPDIWNGVVAPPDFRTDTLKSIRDLKDLYRVITAGVGGTAMPSWTSLTAEQLWAITMYVDSLRPGSVVRSTLERLKAQEEGN